METIKYGGYYKSSKGDLYKVLNPVMNLNNGKLEQTTLFMAVGTGALFTMSDAEFNKRFQEVKEDERDET